MSVGALTAAEEFIWNIILLFNARLIYRACDFLILIERHDGEHMPYHVYYRQAPVEQNCCNIRPLYLLGCLIMPESTWSSAVKRGDGGLNWPRGSCITVSAESDDWI